LIPIIEAVAGFIIFIIVVAVVVIYNSIVVLRNNINAASADIDVLLKKRYDLIPNLVQTVSSYAKYEKNVLTTITSLRTSWANVVDSKMDDKMQASNQMSAALKSIFAVSENYPDLKANQNFLSLQQELTEIEDQIADRREFYNNSVNSFNIMIQQIPYKFLADMLKYQKVAFLQIPDAEKDPIKVKIDTGS
jgi:LemA protein